MTVTKDDFNKIWASESPLTPYSFSASQYKEGWNFIGSTPPSRQMWDSIQKKNDEKFKYLRDNFGTPNIVTSSSQMTDTDKVYVYMGSEAGWNSGHWYYYNEGTSSWEDGGVYNSVAFVTDTTLSIAGQPADAKATGDALAVKADASIVPAVDPTLSISGAAADAAVTGLEIDAISGGYPDTIWEKGALESDGTDGAYRSACRIRTTSFINFNMGLVIKTNATTAKLLGCIENAGTITNTGWVDRIVLTPQQRARIMVEGAYQETPAPTMSISQILSKVDITQTLPTIAEIRDDVFDLTNNNVVSDNVFDGTSEFGFINSATGIVTYNTAWKTTGYIPVVSGKQYYSVGDPARFAFFDANKNFVSVSSSDAVENGNLKNPFVAPSGVSFFRTSSAARVFSKLFVSEGCGAVDDYTTIKDAYNNRNDYAENTLAFIDGKFNPNCFARGNVEKTGNPSAYLESRTVHNKNLFSAPCDIVIKTSNAKLFFFLYNDDKTTITEASSAWETERTIKRGQLYRITIRASADDTIENIVNLVTVSSVALNIALNSGNLKIPEYYFDNDYLPGKVNDILNASPVNGVSFAFVTDFHVTDNQRNSPALIKYLQEHTNSVQSVLFGGDVLVSTVGEGVDVMGDAKRWQGLMSIMGKDNVFQTQGNHDYSGYHIVDGQRVLFTAPSWATIKQLVIGNLQTNKNVVFYDGSKMCYYVDMPTNTRLIVLNDYDTPKNDDIFHGYNGFSVEQVEWIVNVALADDSKRIIVLSHQTYDPNMPGENQNVFTGVQSLFKAIVNKTTYSYGRVVKDFTNTNLTFVAHFVGHMHVDASNVDDGVLTIASTCDALYDTTNRTVGTITEQAFDVVSVDYSTRTIKTVRIGYGADREFTF